MVTYFVAAIWALCYPDDKDVSVCDEVVARTSLPAILLRPVEMSRLVALTTQMLFTSV